MPPKKDKNKKDKKKKDEEEVPGYNVATMNPFELKEYARLLEKDIEAMRNYCSFYQKAEDKLSDFYRIRREELKRKDDLIVTKDVEMEKLSLQVEHKIREVKQWPKYNEFKTEERKTREASEVSEQLEKGMASRLAEQSRRTKELKVKEKELEAERKKTEMTRKEAMDRNSQKLKDVDEFEKALLAKSVKAFVGMLEDTNAMNRMAMKSIEAEALESRRNGEEEFRNACDSYRERLHEYYKKVTRQDLDVIKELALKAKDLEAAIKSTQSRLANLQEQNSVLRASHHQKGSAPRYAPGVSKDNQEFDLIKKARNLKRIEKLRKENQDLENKIKVLDEQTDNLRKEFTQALYKVRQSAELKVHFLEKKLARSRNAFVNDDERLSSSSVEIDQSEKNSVSSRENVEK